MLTTPTYHVFEMYVPHQGAEAVECQVLTEQIHYKLNNQPGMTPRVTASCSKKDGTLTLSLVNTHASESTDVAVTFFPGVSGLKLESWRVLAADDIHAHNTFDQPNRVIPALMANAPNTAGLTLLPTSVNVLTYTVKE
jgi:alpha-N-arabinofuranosidase